MVTTQDRIGTGPGTGAALLAFAGFLLFSAFTVSAWQRHAGGRAAGGDMMSDDGATIEAAAVLSEQRLHSRAASFTKADLAAIMGHMEVDLSEAQLAAGDGEVDLFVMWGQLDLRVPPDWTVVTRDVVTLGELRNRAQGVATDPRKVLRVGGLVIMGQARIIR